MKPSGGLPARPTSCCVHANWHAQKREMAYFSWIWIVYGRLCISAQILHLKITDKRIQVKQDGLVIISCQFFWKEDRLLIILNCEKILEHKHNKEEDPLL